VARGAADHENARRPRRIFLFALRLLNPVARLQPFDGQLEIGIGKAGSRFPGARALAVVVVRLPGDIDDMIEVRGDPVERRIVKALPEASLEFLA
jgi:hypothetical protein